MKRLIGIIFIALPFVFYIAVLAIADFKAFVGTVIFVVIVNIIIHIGVYLIDK